MSSVSVYTPWGLYLKRSTMIHMTTSRVLGLNNLEKSKCVLRHSSFAWQCHTHCFSLHYGCHLPNTWNNDFPPSSLPSSKLWQGIVDWGHDCLLWLIFRVSCCPHSIEHRLHTYIFPSSVLQEKDLVNQKKKKKRDRKEKEEEREIRSKQRSCSTCDVDIEVRKSSWRRSWSGLTSHLQNTIITIPSHHPWITVTQQQGRRSLVATELRPQVGGRRGGGAGGGTMKWWRQQCKLCSCHPCL